jgi:hypothetical protein
LRVPRTDRHAAVRNAAGNDPRRPGQINSVPPPRKTRRSRRRRRVLRLQPLGLHHRAGAERQRRIDDGG